MRGRSARDGDGHIRGDFGDGGGGNDGCAIGIAPRGLSLCQMDEVLRSLCVLLVQSLHGNLVLGPDTMLVLVLEMLMEDVMEGGRIDGLEQLTKLFCIRELRRTTTSCWPCVNERGGEEGEREEEEADVPDSRHDDFPASPCRLNWRCGGMGDGEVVILQEILLCRRRRRRRQRGSHDGAGRIHE